MGGVDSWLDTIIRHNPKIRARELNRWVLRHRSFSNRDLRFARVRQNPEHPVDDRLDFMNHHSQSFVAGVQARQS